MQLRWTRIFTMHAVALVLACLTSAGYAQTVHGQVNEAGSSQALAELLLGLNPTDAWQAAAPGHISTVNRRNDLLKFRGGSALTDKFAKFEENQVNAAIVAMSSLVLSIFSLKDAHGNLDFSEKWAVILQLIAKFIKAVAAAMKDTKGTLRALEKLR